MMNLQKNCINGMEAYYNYEGVTIVSPKATIICSVRPTRATQQAKMEQQQSGKKK